MHKIRILFGLLNNRPSVPGLRLLKDYTFGVNGNDVVRRHQLIALISWNALYNDFGSLQSARVIMWINCYVVFMCMRITFVRLPVGLTFVAHFY